LTQPEGKKIENFVIFRGNFSKPKLKMADLTQPEQKKVDPIQPLSKNFDPDPSLDGRL